MHWWHWLLISMAVLVLAVFVGLSFLTGGPRNVYGFLRYGLPNWHRGDLRVGDSAPDAQLVTLDGQTTLRLHDRIGRKPLVLVFGSFTCPPFRRNTEDIVKLYEEYRDRADFLQVYIREAHPQDEWQMPSNRKDNVVYTQPQTRAQRITIASDFIQRLHVSLPVAIDDMDNRANLLYAAWPERINIINEDGRIVYRGALGPFGYHPEEARAWLAAHSDPKQGAAPVATSILGTSRAAN
jgi:peroxiredoxin